MNTIKISQLPNGTTIDPNNDLIEVSQYNSLTGVYTSIQAKAGFAGGAIKQIGKLKSANINTTLDQQIALSGGSLFVVTDVLMTNASISINTAKDGQWWTGPLRSGNKIAVTNFIFAVENTLNQLTSSSRYVNKDITSPIAIAQTNVTIGNILYFSLGTGQGVAATADIYVYGYIVG